MKRSDVLNHISNDLKDIIQENYIDQKGYEWCANLILLKLEELGMLPPLGKPRKVQPGEKLGSITASYDVDMTIEKHEWEPEDGQHDS